MPNFRFRLPSRNWSIFFTVVGTWYGAYWYDRREKARILSKWCDRVAHLAEKPLPPHKMARSVTIVLAAPPADGLLEAREHFHEYVKPVLVAGGMDWDAIEGRREGDVRAMVAERVRRWRMERGEVGEEVERDEDEMKKDMIKAAREAMGITSENLDIPGGDVVIGRHTWKEYVRGLHEGWLGPLSPPPKPEEDVVPPKLEAETVKTIETAQETLQSSDQSTSPTESNDSPVELLTDTITEQSSSEKTASDEKKAEEEKKAAEEKPNEKKKRPQPPPFISTSEYSSATLPASIPSKLGPTTTISHPHILGFLNTPIRMYRFLNQRYLADEIGRNVAAAVLAAHAQYGQVPKEEDMGMEWEQEGLLRKEEKEWHKSVRQRAKKLEEEGKESLWTDGMVLDQRIAARMAKFVLPDDEGASLD